jgi:hypothetical protein
MADPTPKSFPTDFSSRGTVKVTDKLIIHDIDNGLTEYTTVQGLIDAITTLANLSITGIATIQGVIKGNGTTYLDIYQNTTDGSDNKITRIGGGGDVSVNRGGYIILLGNEAAGSPGDVIIVPGTGGRAVVSGDLDVSGNTTGITKTMVGLPNVDDTSDADKPVSDDTQSALNLKQNKITGGTDAPTGGNDGDIYFQYEELT